MSGQSRLTIQSQRDAVQLGHDDVAQQHIEAVFLQRLQRLHAVSYGLHLMAAAFQGADQECPHGLFVFGNQDTGHDTVLVCFVTGETDA